MDRATKEREVHANNRGLIFHSIDRTSEVNNRFICFSRELNQLSSVLLGNNMR